MQKPNRLSEESKAAFNAGISAMRIALMGRMPNAEIEKITKRAKFIYACSTLSVLSSAKADDTTPAWMQ
jgi:hypothetical protein